MLKKTPRIARRHYNPTRTMKRSRRKVAYNMAHADSDNNTKSIFITARLAARNGVICIYYKFKHLLS